MRRVGIVLLVVTLFALSVCSPVVLGQRKVIRLAHIGAPGSLHDIATSIFANLVKENTNEEVEVKVYAGGLFSSEREGGQNLVNGTVDAIFVSSAAFVGYDPQVGLLEIPFLFKNTEHTKKVILGRIGKELLEGLAAKTGIKPLAWVDYAWETGGRQLTSNKAVRTPDDLKGLRIRSPKVPVFELPLRALGAVPIALDFGELYMALDRGVVDGQHNQILHIYTQKFYEVQKFLTVLNFARTPHILAMSNKAWTSLSPSQQAAIAAAAEKTALLAPEKAAENDARMLAELRAKMTVVELTEAELGKFREIVHREVFPKFREEYGKILDRILEAGN